MSYITTEDANTYISKPFDIICERNGYYYTLTVLVNKEVKNVESGLERFEVSSVRDRLIYENLMIYGK